MKNILRISVLCAPLFLSACGEGFEQVRTDSMVPYGNSRTAGTGIAYVLAKMMPEKALNLKPVVREQAPKPVMEEVERLFKDAQKK